jgi:hypothetical protein
MIEFIFETALQLTILIIVVFSIFTLSMFMLTACFIPPCFIWYTIFPSKLGGGAIPFSALRMKKLKKKKVRR